MNDSTLPQKTPIVAKKPVGPIIPTERWHITPDRFLRKTYRFKSFFEKRRFVLQMLDYELQTEHPCQIETRGEIVVIKLQTEGVEDVTDIDKEYAKFADIIYKDVVAQERDTYVHENHSW